MRIILKIMRKREDKRIKKPHESQKIDIMFHKNET